MGQTCPVGVSPCPVGVSQSRAQTVHLELNPNNDGGFAFF